MTRRAATIAFVLATVLLAAVHVSAQSFAVEKLTLKNGMTVILYPDHSLPVAAVNVWYRVGSKDEPPRRSGFAHLFEHLMFMGTERVPNSDFDRIMEAAGGSNNASTSADRTNYYSSGPASLLPTLLWLDADRLEDLARAMDQKKLDLQRDVVLNELRQTYENQPYGRAELAIQYLLYPGAHPYHFPTIGTEEDLKAAQVNDVKDFFATYYTPSNASLVVAGDFDPKEIRPLVEKLFGTLPRGAEPPRRDVPPATLDGVKRGIAFDKVQLPQLSFAYHAPKGFGPGDAETDLVAAVLADGKSSRLYKRLVVDDALATSVTANNASQLLGSVFRIDVQARPDADLDRVEKVVDEELARFLKEGPTEKELDERKATIEAGKLAALQRLETRADFMNQYEFFWGEPNSFQRDLDRYRNATKAAVLETARRVITQNARVLFRVLPEQPKRSPGPRDSRPKDGAPAAFRPPAPERFTLANGIPVQFWSTPDLPLTAAALVFQTGGPLTAADGRDAGLASMTARMLDEGAGDLDALRFGEAVAALGGQFSASADRDALEARMTILSRNFAKGASLLADAVRRPRLEEKDFARVKRLALDDLAQSDERPDEVAARVVSRALYGEGHPYAWPVDGTPASLEAITLDRVKAERAALVRPDLATLVVAGSLSVSETKAALEKALGDWRAEGPRPPAVSLPAGFFSHDPRAPGLPRGPPRGAADGRALRRASAEVRRSGTPEAPPPRHDPRWELHEPPEPEPEGEERLHVRGERPVRTRPRARHVQRRRGRHLESDGRRSQGVPRRVRAALGRRRHAGRDREGAGHLEEHRRAVFLGPLGGPRDRHELRRARRAFRNPRRGSRRTGYARCVRVERHCEKRARARPRRPRPRRGQGGDPAAAQGRRPPGSRRRRHVGR